ncbi:DUF3857 domain-containing protein [Fulvivirga ligni]|uniref:DUF3857 domain-containing protein n=1 Tax=Fulvivirga ligni TaxID=2904246 RepID=UPI001F2AD6AB|nr:DUF3857 and transglutaminase domain-containing protein [Fulvivirga ligni]UII22521.1 DUF3857 and transglutaminase domain-containing protein [Fulvivirga ligni]
MSLAKPLFFTLAAFFVINLAVAQSPQKFGKISMENLKMTENPIDSSAGAVMIFNYGKTSFDHNFDISIENHIRIKILNSSELDQGTIKIPFGANDRIEKFKAATYNLVNGEIVESKFARKDAFIEDVDDDVKQMRFSLPDVKEGSIIEYTYEVNYGSWGSLATWYFQSTIPVLYSEYVVALPEYFDYKKVQSGFVPLADYEQKFENGRYGDATFRLNVEKFVAKNVPAFKEEPYLACQDDYITKIKFELNRIDIPGTMSKRYLPNSYAHLSKHWAEGDFYGKRLESNNFLKDDVDLITKDATTNEEKIKAIYEYVRDTFEVDYDVISEGLRRIYNLKKGFPVDINFIVIAMCNEAGFNAMPVRLSTRKHGRLHPIYAMQANFNYTICLVKDGDKEYLLDASEKHLPFNTLDKSCLNGQGMIISADNFGWVDLNASSSHKTQVFAMLELDESGTLSGQVSLSKAGYEAIDFKENNKKDLDEYKKTFSENHDQWAIDSHDITGAEDLEAAVVEKIDMIQDSYAESLGDIIYLNPLPYGRMKSNIFKTKDRLFPVSFGAPIEEVLTFRIKLPAGYKVEEKPEQVAIGLPNNGGLFVYSVNQVGEYLAVSSKFVINKVEFSTDEYIFLREFYAQVVAKEAEQVVLKKI